MKRLAIVFGVLCLGIFTMFIERDKKKGERPFSDENENDVDFTGPHGEKILVGSSGGKYYLKGKKDLR